MKSLRHVLVAAAALAVAETRPEVAEPPALRPATETESRAVPEARPRAAPEGRPVRVILPSPYDRR
jgi:hypothetical protein